MSARIPLIEPARAHLPFAYCDGQQVSVETFLQHVSQLAQRLPPRAAVLNLCSDRYQFVVGFAAALVRGQMSLLPPNHAPATVAQLREAYPDVYCLSDTDAPSSALETMLYPHALDHQCAPAPTMPEFDAEQVAAVVFTSGSTGQPLAYQKTWGALTLGARSAVQRFALHTLPGLGLLGTVPVQHMYGLESTALLALHSMCMLHAGRPFFPSDVYAAIEQMPRPRALVTTPVHLRALLDCTGELPQLDFILCATAPLSPALAVNAERRFAAPLYEIYGCTEAGQIASRRPAQEQAWTPFQDVVLRQGANCTWAAGGHVGTDTRLHDHIDILTDGRFYLHGRTADLINIAGKRTSLAHLNHQLNSIAGVRDGVFIMPPETEDKATRLMAFVVAPSLSAEDIVSALRLRIDPVFLPRPLRLVDALPRNATGKLTHAALAEWHRAHFAGEIQDA